ncbi:MAG TPA: ABC transporter permease [Ktedonobacterales bacterium]
MSALSAQRLRALARRVVPVVVAIVCLGLLWQLAATRAGNDQHILPPPGAVWQALLVQREPLALHAGVTLWETIVGFLAALAAGLVAGVALDASPWLRQALYPLLVTSQTVPIITLAPLLVLWFGAGLASKAIVVLLVCFFPIAVALADGLRATDPELMKLFRTFGAGRWRIFWLVRLPGALPSLFSGVRIAITYSVIGAIFSEYVGASAGLGFFMQQKQKGFAVPAVIAAIAVTALLSIALFALVTLIERLSLPWFFQTRREPS